MNTVLMLQLIIYHVHKTVETDEIHVNLKLIISVCISKNYITISCNKNFVLLFE